MFSPTRDYSHHSDRVRAEVKWDKGAVFLQVCVLGPLPGLCFGAAPRFLFWGPGPKTPENCARQRKSSYEQTYCGVPPLSGFGFLQFRDPFELDRALGWMLDQPAAPRAATTRSKQSSQHREARRRASPRADRRAPGRTDRASQARVQRVPRGSAARSQRPVRSSSSRFLRMAASAARWFRRTPRGQRRATDASIPKAPVPA